jgi:hypothetical protein
MAANSNENLADRQIHLDLCNYWLNVVLEIGYKPRTKKTQALLAQASKRFENQAKIELQLGHPKDAEYWSKLQEACETYAKDDPSLTNNPATAYLGLGIAAKLKELSQEIGKQPLRFLKEFFNKTNDQRMYIARSNGLINGVIATLPESFMQTSNAKAIMQTTNYSVGILSWLIYYVRLGLNLFLFAKHIIPGAWLEKDEEKRDWKVRFAEQWQFKKFIILNDLIWGTINLACFFWLVGTGLLGQVGGALTAAFMLVDLALTVYRYHEEITKREEFLKNTSLKELEENSLINEINYLKQKRLNEIVFCLGTFVAFLMVATTIIPSQIMPVALSFLPLVGAAIFAISFIAWKYVDAKIEENKTKNLFEKTSNPIEKLYFQELLRYQKIENIRSTLANMIMPVISFICMVFLPLPPVASAFIAIGCAMAICLLINRAFKQDKPTREAIINKQTEDLKASIGEKIKETKSDYLVIETIDPETTIKEFIQNNPNKFYLIKKDESFYYNLSGKVENQSLNLSNEESNALVNHMNAAISLGQDPAQAFKKFQDERQADRSYDSQKDNLSPSGAL